MKYHLVCSVYLKKFNWQQQQHRRLFVWAILDGPLIVFFFIANSHCFLKQLSRSFNQTMLLYTRHNNNVKFLDKTIRIEML